MLPALLLALQGPPLDLRADTARPHNDALHHDITIVLPDSGQHILGQVQTTWLLRSSEPVDVPLDTAFRVVRVLTDGEGERRMQRITFAVDKTGGVYIPHKRNSGDTLVTSIRYLGEVHDGLVIRTDSATGRRTIFADDWPDRAHKWLPLEDHPSDKATVTFRIEAPPGVHVIANGTLERVDTLAYGRTVWRFEQRQRIPPYGIVLGAGTLATTPLSDAACAVKCVPLAVVTYPEDSAWAVNGPFRRAGDMVDFFSRLVGPFPYDRLSHVESTTIFGGMENPTAIFYDMKAYRERRLEEGTVAHETAHQWFGDAVTEDDWHHLWLSEGFADYFAALWVRHAEGDSAFRDLMREHRAKVIESEATRRPILDPDARDLMGLLNTNNYSRGAWVLHSLRGLIGDSAFDAGIRNWYATYRDSTALSSDFAAVMSKAAETDLNWFFVQELTQPGYPRLDVRWQWKKKRLTLAVAQTQSDGEYRIPNLTISVDGVPVSVPLNGKSTTTVVDGVKQVPQRVVVDPEGWWLMESTVTGGK